MKDMLLPSTETEAADIIRDHAQASRALAIFGGNTRSGFGNRVEAEVSLSSRAITGIVAYNPAEMVMTVKAGTPVAEVEAALSAANQMMAFEPMDHRAVMSTAGEPTIGGVFAANVSGPAALLPVPRVTACWASASSTAKVKPSRRAVA